MSWYLWSFVCLFILYLCWTSSLGLWACYANTLLLSYISRPWQVFHKIENTRQSIHLCPASWHTEGGRLLDLKRATKTHTGNIIWPCPEINLLAYRGWGERKRGRRREGNTWGLQLQAKDKGFSANHQSQEEAQEALIKVLDIPIINSVQF